MILVDSNVWVDVLSNDPVWLNWSLQHLKLARLQSVLAINPVIYAEIAVTFDKKDRLDDFLRPTGAQNVAFSEQVAFLAGKAFWSYRKSKGSKTGVLPDFFIGAQAQAEGWKILTRDAARYRTYFPKVKLICP